MSELKPILNTQIAHEFGEELADGKFWERGGDHTYVPGFSDMRRERDIQIGEVVAGKRQGHDVRTLPVNVRLVRRQQPRNLQPDGLKVLSSGNRGYKAVTSDQVGTEWFAELPAGAVVNPDGTISKGDTMYMWAPAPTVARNRAEIQRITENQLSEPDPNPDGVFGQQVKGANPTVRKLKTETTSRGERLTKGEVFKE